MEIRLVGSTNRIRKPRTARRFVQNHARTCYAEKKTWDELLEESFKPGLILALIKKEHHSPFDHFSLNFRFEDLEKALAMVFNNQGVYATSERSGRYTRMSDISDHQLGLYTKWANWFQEEISRRFPEERFPRLYKKEDGGKTPAEKLSQENARYMTSVFTPTNMTHSVSWRQLNILYHGFNDFMEENRDSENKFRRRLSEGMQSFVDSPEVNKWVIEEAQVKMKGGIPLRFIRGTPVEEHFGEDVYSLTYKASAASFAELHRHRLATFDICKEVELGAPDGVYIPRLVEAAGEVEEWKGDVGSVSRDDFPQAQILLVGERGMREHLQAKSLERECGLAQLETARVVDGVLNRYGEKVPAIKDLARAACLVEGNCSRGGCVFGASEYLERLV
jgi:hypothetical protein